MSKKTTTFRVGFIGLGLMGTPMAKNIHRAHFPLVVYNRNPEKTKPFAAMGIPVASSPAQLASQADVVITMVTGPQDIKEVLLGSQGVIKGAKKGLICIDMSTIGPRAAKQIQTALAQHGIEFLDAPVTGSVLRATSGELTIFIGGKQSVFNKVKPILRAMGTNLQYMGPSGAGQAIKLINNILVAISIEGLAEGMLLGDVLGLSGTKVAQALENTPVMSPMLKMKLPNMAKRKFPTAFSMANMTKDLRLAIAELPADFKLPVLQKVAGLYQKGLKDFAQKDNSAILAVLSSLRKQGSIK